MIVDKRTYPGKRLAGLVLTLLCLAVFSSAGMRAQATGISSSPAMMAQIKCKPGTADLWQAEFEKEIVPSIQEAIAKKDGFTRFYYFESALPYQQFDFVLVYEAKSFSGLDAKRPFPHYAALYRRVGAVRAQQILSEMSAWEQDVHVTLVRTRQP